MKVGRFALPTCGPVGAGAGGVPASSSGFKGRRREPIYGALTESSRAQNLTVSSWLQPIAKDEDDPTTRYNTRRREQTPDTEQVPEVTVVFWIIKVLCTTVGETFADFVNGKLGDNLSTTTAVMGTLLVIALVFQFRAPKYVPAIYWATVVLISVVGTLITDNMVEHFNVSLTTSAIIFAVAMLATFALWYASEKTLSIHSIYTPRREAFYWVAILFTFALGTAAGDLIAERRRPTLVAGD
jgi:uncharacterized membrane-anchored protein